MYITKCISLINLNNYSFKKQNLKMWNGVDFDIKKFT